jgi:hypothetical protein
MNVRRQRFFSAMDFAESTFRNRLASSHPSSWRGTRAARADGRAWVLVTAIAFSLNARAGMSSLSDGGAETTGLLTTRPRDQTQRTENRRQRTEDMACRRSWGKKNEVRTSNFQNYFGERSNGASFKCGVGSAECGIRESQISPHPNPLPGGEGAPSAVLSIILVSAQFHGWAPSCAWIRRPEAIRSHPQPA